MLLSRLVKCSTVAVCHPCCQHLQANAPSRHRRCAPSRGLSPQPIVPYRSYARSATCTNSHSAAAEWQSAAVASFTRWLQTQPACKAAVLTGSYAVTGGAALLLAPKTVLGVLFTTNDVSAGWIRVGGVLFATFGMQYLGTALADWQQAQCCFEDTSSHSAPSNSSTSSSRGGSSSTAHKLRHNRGITSSICSIGSSGGSNAPNSARVPAETATQSSHSTAMAAWTTQCCNSSGFYQASVWSRLLLAAAFAVLVLIGCCQKGLLLLAALNAGGALSMWRALQQQ